MQYVQQKPNERFSQAKVDASVAALKKNAGFEEVELEIRPEANGVRVLFVLHPAMYFGLYTFPGAERRFPYSRLLQVADYPPRGPFTPVDVENAQTGLETFFKQNGYFYAVVKPEIQVDKEHGLANVVFSTRLNDRAEFGAVIIEGPPKEEAEKLRKSITGYMARLKGAAIRDGKDYSFRTLQNAALRLEDQLIKRKYLGSQVSLTGAAYDPETNKADINFNVTLGPKTDVKIEGGGFMFPWTRRKLLPMYVMNGLDPELIQEGRSNLISHYQTKGYFNAKVAVEDKQEADTRVIVYRVDRGKKHRVQEVVIAGNQHIPGDELEKYVTVKKARFFSRGKYSEALARKTAKNLERYYKANGFSEADVVPSVRDQDGKLTVVFNVTEGQRDIVEAMRIEGNHTVPQSEFAPNGLKLAVGSPFSAKLVDEDRSQIVAHYLNKGYLNATFRSKVKPIDKDKHRLEVVYTIEEGPQVNTAKVLILGSKKTIPELIHRNALIKSGEPLREGELLQSESELYNLNIFDWAAIDPRRGVTTQSQEDVVIKVHESRRNDLTYGFGFEVINRGGSVPGGTVALPGLPPTGLPEKFKTSEKRFYGPRASVEYVRRNVRGRAETLTIGALAGRLQQHATFQFTDPYFRGTDWASILDASFAHNSENPIFTSRIFQSGFQLQHALNKDKTQHVFLRYRWRQTGLSRIEIPDLVPLEDRHVRLSTFSASYVRDTRDNTLDAKKGFYQTAELGVNPRAIGSSVNFAKLVAQVAYYKDVKSGIIWANSVRLGVQQPFAGSRVPLSEKFFSGGGSTLRGFPLNGAGPQRTIPACSDPADTSTCSLIRLPVGGPQLLIINSEFRIPVPIKKGLGVVAFYDGGNVFPYVGFRDFSQHYTNTVGIGLRYKTPVGPVRVDLGRNLNPVTGIKATQLFITLGQAF